MRFFIELSYKGTRFAGFQIQKNAVSIQSEVEKALEIFYKQSISLTGSSRTDSGVHALQNFFHFDADLIVLEKHVYNLNAILPNDIVIRRIFSVDAHFHCRFSALHRQYHYHIYQQKSPFLQETAWYYPYLLNRESLTEAAELIKGYTDFTSFSKRNTQTFTKFCQIQQSQWYFSEETFVYKVQANRFLRGMVRGLVATMLKVGRGSLTINEFRQIVEAKDCTKADFSAPPHGLFLVNVEYDFNRLS